MTQLAQLSASTAAEQHPFGGFGGFGGVGGGGFFAGSPVGGGGGGFADGLGGGARRRSVTDARRGSATGPAPRARRVSSIGGNAGMLKEASSSGDSAPGATAAMADGGSAAAAPPPPRQAASSHYGLLDASHSAYSYTSILAPEHIGGGIAEPSAAAGSSPRRASFGNGAGADRKAMRRASHCVPDNGGGCGDASIHSRRASTAALGPVLPGSSAVSSIAPLLLHRGSAPMAVGALSAPGGSGAALRRGSLSGVVAARGVARRGSTMALGRGSGAPHGASGGSGGFWGSGAMAEPMGLSNTWQSDASADLPPDGAPLHPLDGGAVLRARAKSSASRRDVGQVIYHRYIPLHTVTESSASRRDVGQARRRSIVVARAHARCDVLLCATPHRVVRRSPLHNCESLSNAPSVPRPASWFQQCVLRVWRDVRSGPPPRL